MSQCQSNLALRRTALGFSFSKLSLVLHSSCSMHCSPTLWRCPMGQTPLPVRNRPQAGPQLAAFELKVDIPAIPLANLANTETLTYTLEGSDTSNLRRHQADCLAGGSDRCHRNRSSGRAIGCPISTLLK